MIVVESIEKPVRQTSSFPIHNRVSTPEPAFDRLTALAARLLNARAALTVVTEQGAFFTKSLFSRNRSIENFDSRLVHKLYLRVFESGQAVTIGNTEKHGETGAIRAFIGVPLMVAGEIKGCLCVVDYKVRRWTAEQIAIVGDLASSLQTELELRSELKARQDVEKRLRQWILDLEIVNAELEAYGHTIAHDIKGPLNTIANFAGVLQLHASKELSADSLSNLDEILNGIQKMAEMTDQLLQLAKLRNAAMEMTFVDVTPLAERALSRFSPLLREEGVHVQMEDCLLPTMGHAPWIEEVFANLIANAINYRDARKTDCQIIIRSFAAGDMVAYEIQDNGIGMTPENQKRLFSQFIRLNDDNNPQGHGIGLSIVYRLVKRMNGQVEIKSSPGEGSTFCFMLPAMT